MQEHAAVTRGYLEVCTREVLGQTPSEQQSERWLKMRRSWYLGGETFRDRLMEMAATLVKGRKRSSYGKQESLRGHDQAQAGKLLHTGLERLKLTLDEARTLAQNDVRKQALAWLVRSQTVVGSEWIAGELQMGHRSNVSRAVAAIANASDAQRRRLHKLLHTCTP